MTGKGDRVDPIEDYEQGVAAVGPAADDMQAYDRTKELGRIALHRRNLRHLRAYVKASRLHTENRPDCGAAPTCYGRAVAETVMERAKIETGYQTLLMLSAVAEIDRLMTENEEQGVALMAMDADLMDARGEAVDCRRELEEIEQRLRACEELAADYRGHVPAERDAS